MCYLVGPGPRSKITLKGHLGQHQLKMILLVVTFYKRFKIKVLVSEYFLCLSKLIKVIENISMQIKDGKMKFGCVKNLSVTCPNSKSTYLMF